MEEAIRKQGVLQDGLTEDGYAKLVAGKIIRIGGDIMDIKTANLIKANKGLLRQLTALNNRVRAIEDSYKRFVRNGYPDEQELQRMNVYEGSD